MQIPQEVGKARYKCQYSLLSCPIHDQLVSSITSVTTIYSRSIMTSELTNRRQEPQLTSIETVELENGPSSSWRIELEKTLCSPPSNVRKKSYENFAGEDRGRQLLYPESPCGSEAPTAWNSQAPTAQNSRCNSLDRGENGESSKERAPIEYPEDAPYHIFSLKKKRWYVWHSLR